MGELNQLWRSRNSVEQNLTEDARLLLTLKRKICLILNKLTPTNFTILVREFLTLEVDNLKSLDLVVTLLHEKAIKEVLYSNLYARLAKILAEQLNDVDCIENENVSTVISFRTALLHKCQCQFERGLIVFETNQTDLFEDVSQQRAWQNIMYFHYLQQRIRKNGNIIFIANLWKAKVINERVIHECITKLLYSGCELPAEDDLECLCKLLQTAGKEIDANNEILMEQYFRSIQAISSNSGLSSRIRFALEDILELRERSWIPRLACDIPVPLQRLTLNSS